MPEPSKVTQPAKLVFGPCPKCKAPMRLGLIEPMESGREKRVYDCLACGYSETKTVKFR